MKRPRRNHSPVFKAKVALQALRGDKTLAERAQQHDIHPNQITSWKSQLLEHAPELPKGQRPLGLGRLRASSPRAARQDRGTDHGT